MTLIPGSKLPSPYEVWPAGDSVRVTLVAAVARNRVIGAGGDIPWQLPGEQRRFRDLTIGHVLLMGRKTYDSIGRALPGRTTVVVTRQPGWQPADGPHESVLVTSSLTEALEMAGAIDPEVFVVGGGEIYAEVLPLADRLVITWVDQSPEGDAYFPHVDEAIWRAGHPEDHGEWSIVHYERSPSVAKKIR
jgi:dihydrofolate reductase